MSETTTVDMDFVARWIEALESGEYRQGIGALRRGDRFCCLGVACDVADASRWRHDQDGSMLWGRKRSHLPDELCDRLGLWMSGEKPDGTLWELPVRTNRFLTDLNDRGETFLTIAAALRKHYGLPPRTETPR